MGMNKTVRRLIEHYPFLKPLGGRFHSLPKTSLPALSSPDAKNSIFLEAISTLLPDLLTEPLQHIETVILISSSTAFAAPPSLVLLET